MMLAGWLDDLPDPPCEVYQLPLALGVKPRSYGLRWYQQAAKESIEASLRGNRSCLAVLATGGGKTQIFSALAGDWPGDVLVLAHRDELVEQARKRLERMLGEDVEVEQADLRASSRARVVVGSVDTVKQKRRLERMGRDRFSLIIVDEAHHYVATTYRRPLEFFENAKVAGFTATPDRSDALAMGKVFDDVAYQWDIEDGIDQGYLVPISGRRVEVAQIDLSGVKSQAGDLCASQLDEVMLKAVEGIVSETLRLEPDRQGIAFFPGVKSAEYAATKFNAMRPGSAGFVYGGTPKEERRAILKDFNEGRLRYLCNCQVLTEGFDAPTASMIIQGRPTKSRALYAQIVGRGTRVLPGVVDHMEGPELADARRAAVAASGKKDCLILDFVGNAGRHTLVTPEDILGGKYTDEEVALAKKKAEKAPGGDTKKALEAAREELRKLASEVKAKVSSTVSKFDPFAVFHMESDDDARFGYQPMTRGQYASLERMGMKPRQLEGVSKAQATRLLAAQRVRQDQGLATYKQLRALQKFGVNDVNIPKAKASEVISYLDSKGWGRSGAIDPGHIDHILHSRREPGED